MGCGCNASPSLTQSGGSYDGPQFSTVQNGGGTRRRKHTRRAGTRKMRGHGRKRACKCPGGCKRSTCPCYRGRSKPCCTKKCRSRGHRCRC